MKNEGKTHMIPINANDFEHAVEEATGTTE
jgi:hypothetical protein